MSETNMQKKSKSMGIRTKMILAVVPVVVILLCVFFIFSTKMIVDLSKEKLDKETEVYAKDMGIWTSRIFSELNVYKDTIEDGNFKSDSEILAYLETSCEKNEAYPIGLYMGDDAGVYLDGSGWVPDDDWILVERDWYKEGLTHDSFAFGEPYYDSQSGDVCVSASVKVDYENANRVLAVDVYLNYLSELASDITENGFDSAFFITKQSQTILGHPDTQMIDCTLSQDGIDKLYNNIGKELSNGNTNLMEIKGDSGSYYVSVHAIENTDWYLITCMKQSHVLSDLYKMDRIMIIIALVVTILLIVILSRLMNNIVKPVVQVTNALGNVADGDFTQDITVTGSGEIASMSQRMKDFIAQMRTTISDISGTADWLNKQSIENERVSGNLEQSSIQQNTAVSALNDVVSELTAAAEEVSVQIEQLADLISTATNEGESAGDTMNDTVSVSETGKESMHRVSSGMNTIEASMTTLEAQITNAGNVTAKISDMVRLITDIADETNLLSLNASIEAARSGEAGRGFAVVAEQISNLAENSKTAAEEISNLTEEIQVTMQEATMQMEKSVYEVRENAIVVSDTKDIFTSVYDNVANASRMILHVVHLMQEVDQVALQMKDIAANQLTATEQIASSTRDLADCTEQVSSDSDTVSENAKAMEAESKNLTERMNRFKL